MTPLEQAARALLTEVGTVEATSPQSVIPIRVESLAALARALEAVDEPWDCVECKAYNRPTAALCRMCGGART